MNTEGIKLLFEYTWWADQHILDASKRVTPEQYVEETDMGIGHRSLRGTMVHMLDNLWQGRITCQGRYAEPLPTEADYDATELHEEHIPTLKDWEERWLKERAEMRAYLDTLDDAKLAATLEYVIPGIVRRYVLWHYLVSVTNHATQHRSEAAARLTMLGQSPGDMDFGTYLHEIHSPA